MDELERHLELWVDQHSNEIVSFLVDLISKKSENPPGEYDEVTKFLSNKYEAWGLDPKLLGKPGKPNVIGSFEKSNSPTVILYGHTDTVPAGTGWTVPPFEGVVKEGRIFGRGAYDCKGRIAVYTYATRALKETGAASKGHVLLAMTVDEETDGVDGVKYLLDHKLLKSDLAICEGPDTSLWIAHVGLLELTITVEGKSSHAGRLWTGDNAILKMVKIIEVLQKTKAHFESLGTQYRAEFVRYTTLNIGVINGGTKVNMVPSECKIQVDMRIAPDQKIEDVLKKVKEDIDRSNVMPPPKIEITMREDPELLPRDMKVFRIIRDVVKERQGRDIQLVPGHGISDSRWFRRYGIPAITFGGPGGPETGIGGHGADEFVRIEDLLQATKNLAIILKRLLLEGA